MMTTNEKLNAAAPIPAWFADGKYGLFIHFGLYSILGGEYCGKIIPGLAEWIMNYADIPLEEYRRLADEFDPREFCAETIVRDAKRWGMKYVCLTSKHHDGFALYDSACNSYNSVKRSPCRRDFVAELAEACRKYGLTLCLYYSQAQDWDDPDGYVAYRDNSKKNFERYFREKCIPQVKEILTNYGPVGMIWFDTPMAMTEAQCLELRRVVKDLQPDCIISGRIGHGAGDYLSTQDNQLPAFPVFRHWELPATTNESFGFKASDQNWRPASEIIEKLVKIISRGGNYLLNVGPDGTGRIPEASKAILEEVGKFLAANGSAYYESVPTPQYIYETDRIFMTQKPHRVYLTILDPKRYAGKELPFQNIPHEPLTVRILDSGEKLPVRWTRTLEGDPYWGIRIPETIGDPIAIVIEVEIEAERVSFTPIDA